MKRNHILETKIEMFLIYNLERASEACYLETHAGLMFRDLNATSPNSRDCGLIV